MRERDTAMERLLERLARAQGSAAALSESLGRRARKALLDPWVNALGRLVGWLLLAGGNRFLFWVHELVLSRINPPHLLELSPQSEGPGREILELAGRFKALEGRECCFLILFSHPEGGVKMQRFALALYYHVFKLSRRLYLEGAARSYPRFLVAIDPFALDAMDWLSSSFYAGFAHSVHISLDRQPSRAAWLRRAVFLRKSESAEAGFRFIKRLRAGSVVALAQAGGEPQNARLLYTAREFALLLGKRRFQFRREEFLARLRGKSLLEGARLAELERSSGGWSARRLFLEAFAALITQEALQSGVLGAAQRSELRGLLACAGLASEEAAGLAREFESEFERRTPYRERLFQILLGRILRPGIPLMLVPLRHEWEAERIHLGSPEMLWQPAGGGRERFYLRAGVLARESVPSVSEYARAFTSRNFPR